MKSPPSIFINESQVLISKNAMSKNFRFHLLGLPHTVTNKDYTACAYTQKVYKFGKMMKKLNPNCTIIHYGHEDSDLVCDEHVTVTTNRDLEIAYGTYDWRKNFFKFDMGDHAYQTFFRNAIYEVGKRKQKNDFILPFWGAGVRPVCDAHPDLITVEPGIGYAGGFWSPWRIYESYAIMHAIQGAEAVGTCKQENYFAVIPNYFDPDDFVFSEKKSDYFLHLGRIYPGKGVHIAYQICKELGFKLKIAGQGDLSEMGYSEIPGQIEQVGYADAEQRKKLMSEARGFFLISQFLEPFGGSAVEAMFSGTPIITSDWGVFSETNLHGITGYRGRTFEHFCWAAENIDKIKPQDCRDWAMNNYSLDRVGLMYDEFFTMVHDVYTGAGWYQKHPERLNMDWLKKYYPGRN
jgi:glycosyltransferase involved in cell wall biosynthesis